MKKLNIQFSALLLVLMAGLWSNQINAQTTEVICSGDDFQIVLDSSTANTQWQKSTDGVTFTDISGATGGTLTINPVTEDAWYRAVTNIDGNCDAISDTLYVIRSLLVVDAGVSDTICEGTEVTLGGNPTASGGVGDLTYSWSNGSSDANPVVTPTMSTTYDLTVTDSAGCSATASVTYDVISVALDSMVFTTGGAAESFVFPTCVDTVHVKLWGASGQDGADAGTTGVGGLGGIGGYIEGDFVKGANDSLFVYVGLSNGWNGGGLAGTSVNNAGGRGGGASDLRYLGTDPADRVAVAGGGGGGGGAPVGTTSFPGGNGGDADGIVSLDGGDGANSTNFPSTDFEANGGDGGTNSAGGQGGAIAVTGGCNQGFPGITSTSEDGGVGGNGGITPPNCTVQGAGGGGGGGGFFGGGGGAGGQGNATGASFPAAGGGAGSSFVGGLINVVTPAGDPRRSGDGEVRIIFGK